jgi:transposase
MVSMDEPKRKKRTRRSFTDEFKASAVRLVLDEGKSIADVARDLDLTESAFRDWVERARADRTDGKTGLTATEREELKRRRVGDGARGQRRAGAAVSQAATAHVDALVRCGAATTAVSCRPCTASRAQCWRSPTSG